MLLPAGPRTVDRMNGLKCAHRSAARLCCQSARYPARVTPDLADHLIVAFLVFAVPWLAHVEYRRLRRALEAGDQGARLRAYRQTVVVQWGFTFALVGYWLWAGRSLPALGLGLSLGMGFWIGLGLSLAACALLVAQVEAVRRHPAARASSHQSRS